MGTLTGPGIGKFECSDLATCSLADLGTADASDITSGTFGTAQIPNLPTTKITSGTFNANRIPILPIDRYGSAVLVDGSRAMVGTLNMGSHPIHAAEELTFTHDAKFYSPSDYYVELRSKDEAYYAGLHMGHLKTVYNINTLGTLDMNGHPLIDVPTPTQGSHAANKSYVDAQGGGGIGTHANEYHDPDMLCTDGSNAMAGTLNMDSHPIDDVIKMGFRDIHDVALLTEGTYTLSLTTKDESAWANFSLGGAFIYTGIAWTISDKNAGEGLTASNLVYMKSDGKWWKTDADAEATTKGLLGITMADISVNTAGRVLIFGRVASAGWSWTIGASIYVSCTAGGLTETAPLGSGDQVRKIGHALSATTIIFNPDATIIEIT